MDINAFHVFYSPKKEERNFKDYFVLTTILSALQWRKLHSGNLTFYTDRFTLDYFKKYHFNDIWHNCDDTTLDNEIDPNHFDVNTFYAAGKFTAFIHEKCPVAMIDIDLIIWHNLYSLLKRNVSVFTHYENASPRTIWYEKKERLHKAKNYEFHKNWDFSIKAVNTSFVYFSDEKLKDYYVNCAFEYMYNNFIDKQRNNIGNPEILFVEQRLLPMCYKDFNVTNSTTPLLNITWNPPQGRFVNERHNNWKYYKVDNNSIATHLWIAKSDIENNKLYRNYLCCRLIEKIIEIDDRYYDLFANNPSIYPYIKLLENYKTTNKLIELKMASNILYLKKEKKLNKSMMRRFFRL